MREEREDKQREGERVLLRSDTATTTHWRPPRHPLGPRCRRRWIQHLPVGPSLLLLRFSFPSLPPLLLLLLLLFNFLFLLVILWNDDMISRIVWIPKWGGWIDWCIGYFTYRRGRLGRLTEEMNWGFSCLFSHYPLGWWDGTEPKQAHFFMVTVLSLNWFPRNLFPGLRPLLCGLCLRAITRTPSLPLSLVKLQKN